MHAGRDADVHHHHDVGCRIGLTRVIKLARESSFALVAVDHQLDGITYFIQWECDGRAADGDRHSILWRFTTNQPTFITMRPLAKYGRSASSREHVVELSGIWERAILIEINIKKCTKIYTNTKLVHFYLTKC